MSSNKRLKEKRQVLRTTQRYFDALADGDGKKACSYLTPRAQKEASRTVPKLKTCEDAHEWIALKVFDNPEMRRGMQELMDWVAHDDALLDEAIKIRGRRAYANSNRDQPMLRDHKSGEWKFDHNPLHYTETNEGWDDEMDKPEIGRDRRPDASSSHNLHSRGEPRQITELRKNKSKKERENVY